MDVSVARFCNGGREFLLDWRGGGSRIFERMWEPSLGSSILQVVTVSG